MMFNTKTKLKREEEEERLLPSLFTTPFNSEGIRFGNQEREWKSKSGKWDIYDKNRNSFTLN